MQRIVLTLRAGENTCARLPGEFCQFFGSRKFGTAPCCTLFPDGDKTYTDLVELDGWVQRCDMCKAAPCE